jgi:hypothetical protein
LLKSSSANAGRNRTLLAFRTVAALFGATTILIAVIFARALGEHEIRSGLATYGLFNAAATFGLWERRRWGRNLALVILMGNFGLGGLSILSAIMSRRGPVLAPVILFAVSLTVGYWLSRPVFSLDDE